MPLKFLRAPEKPIPKADGIAASSRTRSPKNSGAAAAADVTASSKIEPETANETTDASVTGEADEKSLGRAKRKIKPTTCIVNGFSVKRQNMYDMEGGEASVWDRLPFSVTTRSRTPSVTVEDAGGSARFVCSVCDCHVHHLMPHRRLDTINWPVKASPGSSVTNYLPAIVVTVYTHCSLSARVNLVPSVAAVVAVEADAVQAPLHVRRTWVGRLDGLERRFPNVPRHELIAALHAHKGNAAEVGKELQGSVAAADAPSMADAPTAGAAADAPGKAMEELAATTPGTRPRPPLSSHLRALADRRAAEVLPGELERLSTAAAAQLEARYKNTPYYKNNRPYVPLWRCLAAAFLEPLLLMLRTLPRSTPESEALVLCDLYWQSALELPLMPLTALEALAQQHPDLVLKPQLAETDGSPDATRHVKLVLAVLPHVVAEAFHCAG